MSATRTARGGRRVLVGCVGALLLLAAPGMAVAPTTELVSVSSAGAQAGANVAKGAISASGRFVAFSTPASNVVPQDTNGDWDVFVHDRATGQTERVSVTSSGAQADNGGGGAFEPLSLSADGRFVLFQSGANNLVLDPNGFLDRVYVHDRVTGLTENVSVSSAGVQANESSDPGAISANGRFVAFTSTANNLVRGDTNGGRAPGDWTNDVFVHDRVSGRTERVSVSSRGVQGNGPSVLRGPSISANGRYVAFWSKASNLVPGDTDGPDANAFVHDRVTGRTSLVSRSSNGAKANKGSRTAGISGDGRFVVFVSKATNLGRRDNDGDAFDVFVRDRDTGRTRQVSLARDGGRTTKDSRAAGISPDGRFVLFNSGAPNLVPGDTNGQVDVFVYDRRTGQNRRVSVTATGRQTNTGSTAWGISSRGRFVAFGSAAANLVPGDTNGRPQAFVRGPLS
jgi:Tol biopolymer transport system component